MKLDFDRSVEIGVRGFSGAVFGAMLGFGWMTWLPVGETALINWSILAVVVLGCAWLAIAYGDRFWEGVRDLF